MAGERKTRAIMFSDMKGYSAAMSRDETSALALLAQHNAIVRRVVDEHGGELVKFLGDGSLSCFESAADAVGCAMALQRALADRNAQLPDAEKIVLRIGIHIGDVVLRDGDAFGDGVNLAARVEPLAPPGGICITQTVYDIVRSRPEIQTVSLGAKELKNISQAVTIYQVVVDSQRAASERVEPPSPPLTGLRRRWVWGSVGAMVVLGCCVIAWWSRPVVSESVPEPALVEESAPAEPLDEVRAWLRARGSPLRIGLTRLTPVGDSASLAQTLDLRFGGLLQGLDGVEVVAVDAGSTDAPSLSRAAPEADIVLAGAVGALGGTRIVNLQRIDVARAAIGARAYMEGSEDEVASAFPGLLRDLLVLETRGIDASLVKSTVNRYAGQLKYCYEQALQENATLEGRVEVGWMVEPSGRTTAVHVVEDSVGDEAMTSCMLGKIETWLFPSGIEGDFSWPFVFRLK